MSFLLDASVSRYSRPLKIRDLVWEIKYWDLWTLTNVKSNFFFNWINKKATCDIFHCVSVSACRFTVFCFVLLFWLYCITDCYSLHMTKPRLLTSIWQSPGPVATKMPLFRRISSLLQFFFSPPTQEENLLFTLDFLTRNSRRWDQWSHLSWQWSIWSIIDTDCWRWWHFNPRAQSTTLSRRCRRRSYCSGTKSCRKEKGKNDTRHKTSNKSKLELKVT